jgi:hypothetical protein
VGVLAQLGATALAPDGTGVGSLARLGATGLDPDRTGTGVLADPGATGLDAAGAGTGVLAERGAGLEHGGDDGTGTGVEDAEAPDAESSVAEPRWPVADDRVSPAPPMSSAATGSPIQVAACRRDIVI